MEATNLIVKVLILAFAPYCVIILFALLGAGIKIAFMVGIIFAFILIGLILQGIIK